MVAVRREEDCFAGGGMARKPISPTPPSPSLVAVPGGGFGLGLPFLPCRGSMVGADRLNVPAIDTFSH